MARGANGGSGAFGFRSSRISWALIILAAMAACLFGRLVWLHVIDAENLSAEGAAKRTVSVELSAHRGTIYDRNGKILATDVNATTIYCNPKEVTDPKGEAAQLAVILGGDAENYQSALETEDTTFAYVKRKVDSDKGEQVENLNLDGIYFLDDVKRTYPYGKVAGQILGLVDVDDKGQTGLELYYDDILQGTNGKLVLQQGAGGISIPGATEVEEPAQDGQDIVISIDIEMQQYLEERLAQGVEDIGGDDGTAVLMDADSGEIIAIASTPYLDPSDRTNIEDGATSIKAITSQFEPGSIFKSVSAMSLLEAGAVTIDTVIDCPSSIQADEYYISDAHERGAAAMSMRQIIADSSNVGISLAVEQNMGFTALYQSIIKYGLNDGTGVDYPGEATGYLTAVNTWSAIQAYNVTFGQGVSVTPLQMVRFYGAIANNGVAYTPHFLISKPQTDETVEWESEQIIENTDAIPQMTEMLKAVVTEGTGTGAAIDGYTVAGKTGTAEYATDSGAYASGSWNLDFIGFLPDASTNLVCFVGVNHVPYERNTTAVFKDIMSDAISRYRIVQG